MTRKSPPAPRAPRFASGPVFEDPLSRELLRCLERLAPTDATVLVLGETGTGKEVVARRVHELGRRAGRPFVAVNCGALTESLVDSELFGYERGAFTGAALAKAGWFEAADGGTLFLDEVGDLSPASQVKLLRVLQEREIVRLGSRRAIPIDVRIVAATNVDLRAAVAAGRFREDLYYRLDVATLRLAPLRERTGDIPQLAERILRSHAERTGTALSRLAPEALEALRAHRWPGNVRELENVLQRAALVCAGELITPGDLGLEAAAGLAPAPPRPPPTDPAHRAPEPDTAALAAALQVLFEGNVPDLHARIEEVVMKAAYQYCERNQIQTAKLLGVSRNVVRARLIEFGALPGALRRSAPQPAAAARGPHLHAVRLA
jgi:sigma-54-specific transcriptional regulator